MARIAVGGFGHETNSFVAHRADFAYFADHRDRPPLVRGDSIRDWLRGGSFPISGFMAEMENLHQLVPLVWAHGSAGGPVTADAFERIAGEMVGRLSEAGDVDAVYLDLHGAMVSTIFEDAEGELLRRVRAAVGDIPIVISLDYHANITPEIVDLTDGLVVFLTYPHIDRPQTGIRAAHIISHLLEYGRPAGRAFRKLPFLIPTTGQCTLIEPSKGVTARSVTLQDGLIDLAYAAGFPASDLFWCGPAIVAHAFTQEAADKAADELFAHALEKEADFALPLLSADAAVAQAMEIAATAKKPVILADAQDNPGAGGFADTTGILKALLKARVDDAILGILCDAAAASAAHAAGEGASLKLKLGGYSGTPGVHPLEGDFFVKKLGSGRFRTTGPVTGGLDANLGPMALLSIGGVDIIVSSKRMQAMDLAPFRHLGVEPAEMRIIVLKSAVHFRAEFDPIAETTLIVAAPGGAPDNPEGFPYLRLRPGVRLRPMGQSFKPSPDA